MLARTYAGFAHPRMAVPTGTPTAAPNMKGQSLVHHSIRTANYRVAFNDRLWRKADLQSGPEPEPPQTVRALVYGCGSRWR